MSLDNLSCLVGHVDHLSPWGTTKVVNVTEGATSVAVSAAHDVGVVRVRGPARVECPRFRDRLGGRADGVDLLAGLLGVTHVHHSSCRLGEFIS